MLVIMVLLASCTTAPPSQSDQTEPLSSPPPSSAESAPPSIEPLNFDDIVDTGVDDTDLPKPNYSGEARSPIPQVPGNMLVNPGFEDALDGWKKQPWNARITMEPNTEIVHSGEKSILMTVTDYVDASYPNICQDFKVDEGDTIRGGVWARTYDCHGGVGPYAVIAYMDARGNRIAFESSVWGMNTAVSEWTLLTVVGTAPKDCVSISFQVLFNGYGEAAFDDAFLTIESEMAYEGTEVGLLMRPAAAIDSFLGFGAQGDMFLITDVALKEGIVKEDIDRLKEYISDMKIHHVRLFFSYKWWENTIGVRADPKQSADLENFVELVRIYYEYGVEVNVCPWGDSFAYASWQISTDGNRAPPDSAIVPTAQSLAALLKYLIVDLGFDNVKYVTLANEPDNDPTTMFNTYRYKKSIKALDWALRAEGIRDRLRIIGSDDSSAPMFASNTWFRRATDSDVIKYMDYAASHTYVHWIPTVPLLSEWIRDRIQILEQRSPDRQIPLVITEYGYGYAPGENEKYEYGLFIVDFAIEAVNSGVALLTHWSLADTYYDAQTYSQWGLIRFKTAGWSARPPWYSYSLLTRHTSPGDSVYAFDSPTGSGIRASLFRNDEDKISIVVTNTGFEAKTVTFSTDGISDRGLSVYLYSEATLPADNHPIIPSGSVAISGNQLTIEVPGESAYMITER